MKVEVDVGSVEIITVNSYCYECSKAVEFWDDSFATRHVIAGIHTVIVSIQVFIGAQGSMKSGLSWPNNSQLERYK